MSYFQTTNTFFIKYLRYRYCFVVLLSFTKCFILSFKIFLNEKKKNIP